MDARLLGALLVLCAGSAGARDVVVFDRGGGADRLAAARQALSAAGDTVISDDESAELDVAYAAGCGDDAACYARAGVAGSVEAVFVVYADDVLAVDVKGASGIRKKAPTAAIAVAIDHLLHPAAWGTLDTRALPAGSAVMVGGVAYDGGDLAVGPATVEIRAPGREAVSLTLQVLAGDNVLQLPAEDPAPVAPSTDGVHPGLIVVGAGAATAVAGAIVFSIGELAFLEAERQIKQDPSEDLSGDALDDAALMANVGLGVIAVGVVAGVVGGVLAVSAE